MARSRGSQPSTPQPRASDATTPPQTQSNLAVVCGILVVIVAAGLAAWQSSSSHPPPPRPESPVPRLLSSLEQSFSAYARALDPRTYPEDLILASTELASMRSLLVQLHDELEGNQPLEAATELRLHGLPLRALYAQMTHRGSVIKETLHTRLWTTSELVEAADRQANGLLLAPLKLLLRPPYVQHMRWAVLLAGEQMSALEFAVDRGLKGAVDLMLPHARVECQPAPHVASTPRLSALQLAENNADTTMAQLLRADANPCLITSTLDAEASKQREGILARPIDLNAFRLPPATQSLTSDNGFGDGGWRPSASNASLRAIASLARESAGCPFARVPLRQMTAELFRTHVLNKQPLIVSDALDATRWSIARQFTREAIMKQWARVNLTAGAIPYGKQFGERGGLVTFAEFTSYMDDTYARQKDASAIEDPDQAAPFYIFDGTWLDSMRWNMGDTKKANATPKSSTSSSSSSPLDDAFYHLPAAVLDSFASHVSSVSQFWLGPELSGAPFHYHCPAVNLLVYGRKQWWLHPPSYGLYSKQPPLTAMREKPSASSPPPFSCVQQPGDLFFVPSGWSHATINLQESIGIAVEIDVGGC